MTELADSRWPAYRGEAVVWLRIDRTGLGWENSSSDQPSLHTIESSRENKMNQQPTVILLKFTDFLNNLDSLAFLRLSHSVWLSHRSRAGRYRIKPKIVRAGYEEEYSVGPNLSRLPRAFFSRSLNDIADFSPVGNFLVDSINLARLEDFRLFREFSSTPQDSTSDHDNSSISVDSPVYLPFQVLKNILIDFPASEDFPADGEKIVDSRENMKIRLPDSLERLKMVGSALPEKIFSIPENCPVGNSRLLSIDFSGLLIEQENSRNLLNHKILQQQKQLQILRLPDNFNCPIEPGDFPASLTELYFGQGFCSSILPGSLPKALEILQFPFNSYFNEPLPFPLPSGLKELQLGPSFCHAIFPGQLPGGLKSIKFGDFYRQFIPGVFPTGLEELTLGSSFEQPLTAGILPASLKHFSCYLKDSSFDLPTALERLQLKIGENFRGPLPRLPASLQKLKLAGFNSPIDSIDSFPPQLRVIDFGFSFDSPLNPGIFPSSVEEIIFPGFNKQIEIGVFPPGLKKISFGAYNQPLPVGIFPDGIKSIDLGYRFCSPLAVGLFPPSVRELRISTKFPLSPGVFPEGVESITFAGFNERLFPGLFPFSLRRLEFQEFRSIFTIFQQDILPGDLPPDLGEFLMGRQYYGHLPLSSLPHYFRPDIINSEKIRCRLAPHDYLHDEAKALLARYGDEEFLVHSLRVSIGPKKDTYVVLSPVDGNSPAPFIVPQAVIQREEKIIQGEEENETNLKNRQS